MAAPKENLLSLGHLTGRERNTFTKQRQHGLKQSVNRPILLQDDFSTPQSHQHMAMHLQQRWQELKERELTAQQHNRQLLQQFEEAQDSLREMLTLTAAMKTIRMEYERYLEESAPRWQKQLKEKTQSAHRKRMEEYLKSCLKNTDDQMTKSTADQTFLSKGPTTKPPQKHYSQISQDGSSHLPYMQSSWQTQMPRFPIRVPYQLHGSPHVPPSVPPPPIFPQPFQLASMPHHHHPWPTQNPPGQASPQPDYSWSWTTGIPPGCEALWGQLYTEEPPPERGVSQVAGGQAERSSAPSPKRERGGGTRSSCLSQELDIKPVRLSSGPAESSESSKEFSQTSSEKRKKKEKRGRSQRPSSDRERCSSQESCRTSSAIITAAVTVAQSSESEASSEKSRTSTGRRRRSAGLAVGPPRSENVVKEKSRSNGDDSGSDKGESQSTAEESRSEEARDRSPDNKSESCREELGSQREEESGSVSIKNGGGDEIEKEESSSEESSAGEKGEEDGEHEKNLGEGEEDEGEGDGEEKKDSQRDEEQEGRGVEDDDEASEIKNTTEEEEEEIEERESEDDQEETSDRLKNEDEENGKQDSASSQDEEVDEEECEGGEDQMEEDGESDEEEEQRRDEAAEAEDERDSEDSIISPQNKSKKMHIIPEEASEDDDEEEGSKTGSSDDDSNEFSDEDIEHLLAPQEQSQKKGEKDLRADEKPKATCDKVEIFQMEEARTTKTDHPSDSEEFDDFYD